MRTSARLLDESTMRVAAGLLLTIFPRFTYMVKYDYGNHTLPPHIPSRMDSLITPKPERFSLKR
jgi:hypothetical protein